MECPSISHNLYYFAYGSNMDFQQMTERMEKKGVPLVEKSDILGKAILKNYELDFSKAAQGGNFGYATVFKQNGSEVEGVLYSFSEAQINAMDVFEGANLKIKHYTREEVEVECQDKWYRAIAYVANPIKTNKDLKPTAEYLGKLIRGAEQSNLSSRTITRLRQWETYQS